MQVDQGDTRSVLATNLLKRVVSNTVLWSGRSSMCWGVLGTAASRALPDEGSLADGCASQGGKVNRAG